MKKDLGVCIKIETAPCIAVGTYLSAYNHAFQQLSIRV